MSIQAQLDKLREIELLCQVIIRQENPASQKDWSEGRTAAAGMVLEIINRKGEQI
jgi:hypothetical protein